MGKGRPIYDGWGDVIGYEAPEDGASAGMEGEDGKGGVRTVADAKQGSAVSANNRGAASGQGPSRTGVRNSTERSSSVITAGQRNNGGTPSAQWRKHGDIGIGSPACQEPSAAGTPTVFQEAFAPGTPMASQEPPPWKVKEGGEEAARGIPEAVPGLLRDSTDRKREGQKAERQGGEESFLGKGRPIYDGWGTLSGTRRRRMVQVFRGGKIMQRVMSVQWQVQSMVLL